MRRQRGLLVPGKTILDATSGNTGIALAMLGAALGIPVQLAMPSNVSPERKRILRAYGAEVDWTDPDQGSDGAIRRARELAGNDPERFCYLDQYSNDANWLAHYHTHRSGDSGADRRAGDAFRRRAGNDRDVYGHDAAAEGAQSRDSGESAFSRTRLFTDWKA